MKKKFFIICLILLSFLAGGITSKELGLTKNFVDNKVSVQAFCISILLLSSP